VATALAPHVIELPPLCIRAAVQSIDDDKRTVEVVFSTGAAVPRVDYWSGKRYIEKLSLAPSAVRLTRLNAGAPVLDAHSGYSIADQIGVVEPDTVKLLKTEARVTLRFSARAAVQPIWEDVRAGIVRNVSVGYSVYKYEEEAAPDTKIPIRTATDWEPFEISMVPMPADVGAQVRRGDAALTTTCVIVRAGISDADRGRWIRWARLRAR
jgi:hypothetical protein